MKAFLFISLIAKHRGYAIHSVISVFTDFTQDSRDQMFDEMSSAGNGIGRMIILDGVD